MIFFRIHTFLAILLISIGLNAQSYKLDNDASKLEIEGTSNIHDWTIQAKNSNGLLVTEFSDGVLKKIDKLHFKVLSESLMSGKSGMDKNTYKALETSKNKEIIFTLKKVSNIQKIAEDTYKIKAHGSLMIAGKTRDINLDFHLTKKADTILLTGAYQLNMTHYGVEAPTAMFGTIKTGEDVVINFESTFNK